MDGKTIDEDIFSTFYFFHLSVYCLSVFLSFYLADIYVKIIEIQINKNHICSATGRNAKKCM